MAQIPGSMDKQISLEGNQIPIDINVVLQKAKSLN
jgi:hypothetical protein